MGLAMLADKLPAEKAADWGLIWAAYDDAEFAAKVDALAAQIAAMPTKAWCAPARRCTPRPAIRWSSSSPSRGGFMRELGWSPTTPKASPPSWKSAHRSSPGNEA